MRQRWHEYAESVREFQPRVAATLGLNVPKNRNAESVGKCRCTQLRELFQSSRLVWLELESQGCSNPGLELANAFSVPLSPYSNLQVDRCEDLLR